jgi:hypothetical protein
MKPDSAEESIAGWDLSQAAMEPTTNEQLELITIADRLGSCIVSDEPGIADEKDLHNEAKLLMSLSCTIPTQDIIEMGQKTSGNDSVASSQSNSNSSYSSGSSRRSNFSFSCPSLSLENNHFQEEPSGADSSNSEESFEESSPSPAELLGRKLTMDDRDVMRLSAEAMARNVMQSYQKAIDWRLQCWMDQLSHGLDQDKLQDLVDTPQVKLLVQLSHLQEKVKVLDASTSFKLLNHRPSSEDSEEPTTKKLKKTESTDSTEDPMNLLESEYKFSVSHALVLEGNLNISTPAGHVQIDLQVPGTMEGTFLSPEEGPDQLMSVQIDLRTDILASMIEKSSRMVVRASAEALLKPEDGTAEAEAAPSSEEEMAANTDVAASPSPQGSVTSSPLHSSTTTPKRKYTDERVSGVVVVTPRDTSSPSSCGDSDGDQEERKPVLLSIPNDFKSSSAKRSLRMVTPQPSRFRNTEGMAVPFPPLDLEMTVPSKPSFEAVKPKTKTTAEEQTTEDAPSSTFPGLVQVARAMTSSG